MNTSLYRSVAAALVTASFLVSSDALAEVDLAKSSITAISKQMNVPVEGVFKRFSAHISFDPARLSSASAQVTVDVGSYDLGDASYNSQIIGNAWFDAKTYPTATFVSSAIAAVGGNRYNVTGKLTIKGKSETVMVPMTLSRNDNMQSLDGTLPIKRLQFGIGAGEWKDTSIVADDVTIKFHIVGSKF